MTQAISLRLPQRLLAGLRRVAGQHEVSYQLLIKQWLAERLAQETALPTTPSLFRPTLADSVKITTRTKPLLYYFPSRERP